MSISRADSIASLQNKITSLEQERKQIVMNDYKNDVKTFTKESIVRTRTDFSGKAHKISNEALLGQIGVGLVGTMATLARSKNLKQLSIGTLLTLGVVAGIGFASNAINHYTGKPTYSDHDMDLYNKTFSIDLQIEKAKQQLKELEA